MHLPRTRVALPALIALAVAVAGSACKSGGSSPAAPTSPTAPAGGTAVEVGINGDAYLPTGAAVFAPNNITVDRGTTITWKNNDQTLHTTTANGGLWDSSVAAAASFSRQFTAAGTFEYHCTIHPYMTGTVVVR